MAYMLEKTKGLRQLFWFRKRKIFLMGVYIFLTGIAYVNLRGYAPFEAILARSVSFGDKQTNGKPTKLFLFAYMRGGSSVAGELFNCDPSATMWYEPGDAFFSAYYGLSQQNLPQNDLYFKNMTRRKLQTDELEAMVNYYTNLFSCNYDALPPETMAHHFIKESTAMDDYFDCRMSKGSKDININACKRHLQSICSSDMVEVALGSRCHVAIAAVKPILDRHQYIKNEQHALKLLKSALYSEEFPFQFRNSTELLQFIRHYLCVLGLRRDNVKCLHKMKQNCDQLLVVQVNRMKMEDLEPLIKANPDLYVLHYTRDPRAIALSRHNTGILTFDEENNSTVREAQFVCRRMREDLKQRLLLENKYPGVFKHLTYESLVLEPERFASTVYGTLNKTYPKQWKTFIAEHMHSGKNSTTFGIYVKNATELAFKWRSMLPKQELEQINSFCADVVTGLGYQL